MKTLFLFIFLIFPAVAIAQERTQVTGRVQNVETPLENVHVKNISSGKFSVSGASGEFLLSIRSGDTLVLSHVGMNDLISFIKKEDVSRDLLIFRMSEQSDELKEVVVNEVSEINAVSLGIIPKKIEKLSMNERRLETAGDFKPVHLLGLLVGSLQIDPILNAINGRTKKLKKNIEVEKKQRNIAFLEIYHMEYLQKDMNLSDHEAQLLIGFVIEDAQLNEIIASGNEAQMHLYLHDAWFRLQAQARQNSD